MMLWRALGSRGRPLVTGACGALPVMLRMAERIMSGLPC